jgi:putative transposase
VAHTGDNGEKPRTITEQQLPILHWVAATPISRPSVLIETLADVMLVRGIPEDLHSDNSPEFMARELRKWLASLGTGNLYIEPGSPWDIGYCESFNGNLRDEYLNGEIFYSLKEAQVVIE